MYPFEKIFSSKLTHAFEKRLEYSKVSSFYLLQDDYFSLSFSEVLDGYEITNLLLGCVRSKAN